jgi:hypothetical protein
MKIKLIVLVITLLIVGCNNLITNKKNRVVENINIVQTSYSTRAINKNPDQKGDEDTLLIDFKGSKIEIHPNGYLYWDTSRRDSLKLTSDMFVTEAFYYMIDSLLILFVEESDGDYGTCEIININLNNKQICWKTPMDGFNLGKPIIRGNFVFLTTIGTIGKLDLRNGKYAYQYIDLYDTNKYSFNSFDTIVFKDSLTFFISKNYHSKHMDSAIINERTNSLIIKK